MKKFLLSLSFFALVESNVWAQTTQYFVYFKDKKDSPYSLTKPEKYLSERAILRRKNQNIPIKEMDLPVNPSYTTQVAQTGAKVKYTSKWFNGVLVEADANTMEKIKGLPFVKVNQQVQSIEKDSDVTKSALEEVESLLFVKSAHIPQEEIGNSMRLMEDYGFAKTQNEMLGVDMMHHHGFRGEGMYVAVTDGGFPLVNTLECFSHLKIADTYDFVGNTKDVFKGNSHGTSVLSTMAAKKEKVMIGTAYNATYHLYISENGNSESPTEEINWLLAAERADSVGVDVINVSLGYSDFDNSQFNYNLSQLDGNTALITQAADKAASTGMLVITSAGNTGNSNTWKKISFPGDADSILTVGAVDKTEMYAPFSSIGHTTDNRIKPDIMAMGENAFVWKSGDVPVTGSGTSYASPILCGMVVGFWQANKDLNNQQVMDFIRKSGSRYDSPDEKYGYGIPNFNRAMALRALSSKENNPISLHIFPNPSENGRIYVEIPSKIQSHFSMELYDLTGKQVWEGKFENASPTIELSFEGIRKGMYILHLNAPHVKAVQKIVL